MKRIAKTKGFSLLEVLIAFVILVIGILGATTLVIRSSQMNMKSYETERVAFIANTIIEKMRADPVNADKYRTLSPSEIDCSEGKCTDDQVVQSELFSLQQQLNETKLPGLPEITQIITRTKTNVLGSAKNTQYLLTITWGKADKSKSDKDEADKDKLNKYTIDFVVSNPDTVESKTP